MGITPSVRTTIKGSDGTTVASLRELSKMSGKSRSYIRKKIQNGGFVYDSVTYTVDGVVKQNGHRVLVIPDLHAPFVKEGYLEFCKSIAKKYNTNKTIFLGDILDFHTISFHDTCPESYSANEELDLSIKEIKKWHEAFPNATVLYGNHTSLIMRKLYAGGVPKVWMKQMKDVLHTPTWTFCEDYEYDGVLYLHGEGRTARNACRDEMQSVVQGHRHSSSYIEYYASPKQLCFAMQLGCGINRHSYAFAYGKHFKKPQINCGVVLENGRYAIIEPMGLGI